MGRKHKGDVRKPEILEHLYEVLKEEGIEGASLAKVAEHMGVYPSMLVHYFKTKDQMLIEFVGHILKRFEEWYTEGLEEIIDPHERLTFVIDRIFLMKGQGVIEPRVFYALWYLGLGKPEIKQAFVSMYALFQERLAVELAAGIKPGTAKRTDIHKLTTIITVITEGLDYYRLVCSDPQAAEEAGQYFKQFVLNLLKQGV